MILSLIGTAIAATQAPGQPPALWAGLKPGTQAVGYRVVEGTPTVSIWYPAERGGTAMRFGNYVGADSTAMTAFLTGTGIPAGVVRALFASPVAARWQAPALPGPWPVVLVAQGNGEVASDQAILSEYLASHGFVIITTPSPTRETPLTSEDQVGAAAERQADDLARAIDVAGGVVPLDTARIAVVGHSFGARSALLLTMRDRRIRGLVSLDGGIGTATAVGPFTRAPSFDWGAPLPQILHYSETLDSFMTPNYDLLRRLRTPQLIIRGTSAMHHVHFTSYGFIAAVFPDVAKVTHASRETTVWVNRVARGTLSFLEGRLH